MKNTYICINCKKIYKKGQTDKETEKEYKNKFGNMPPANGLVCDYCYKKIIAVNEN